MGTSATGGMSCEDMQSPTLRRIHSDIDIRDAWSSVIVDNDHSWIYAID